MSEISAAQVLPLLELLPQPALVLMTDGTIRSNGPGAALVPANGAALPVWLGPCADAYAAWDRRGPLTLVLPRDGTEYLLTAHALTDGTLLLLQPETAPQGDVLAAASQVLRQPLTDLSALAQQLSLLLSESEDPGLWEQAAAMNRHLYRLTRITCNLADLERLRTGQYRPRIDAMELKPYLERLLSECADACAAAGRALEYQLPAQPVTLWADSLLLERAVLNLISNALKYGDPASPITVRCEALPSAVLLRVRNRCTEKDAGLLTDAFHRLWNRGSLPDPRWGLGLGLPLARAVAQLHGGTAALEQDADGTVTVTLSFSRRRNPGAAEVKTPPFDYTGGMRPSLLELCESLPASCFSIDAL